MVAHEAVESGGKLEMVCVRVWVRVCGEPPFLTNFVFVPIFFVSSPQMKCVCTGHFAAAVIGMGYLLHTLFPNSMQLLVSLSLIAVPSCSVHNCIVADAIHPFLVDI